MFLFILLLGISVSPVAVLGPSSLVTIHILFIVISLSNLLFNESLLIAPVNFLSSSTVSLSFGDVFVILFRKLKRNLET